MRSNLITDNVWTTKGYLTLYYEQQAVIENVSQLTTDKETKKALQKHLDDFIKERRLTTPFDVKYLEIMEEANRFLKDYQK